MGKCDRISHQHQQQGINVWCGAKSVHLYPDQGWAEVTTTYVSAFPWGQCLVQKPQTDAITQELCSYTELPFPHWAGQYWFPSTFSSQPWSHHLLGLTWTCCQDKSTRWASWLLAELHWIFWLCFNQLPHQMDQWNKSWWAVSQLQGMQRPLQVLHCTECLWGYCKPDTLTMMNHLDRHKLSQRAHHQHHPLKNWQQWWQFTRSCTMGLKKTTLTQIELPNMQNERELGSTKQLSHFDHVPT